MTDAMADLTETFAAADLPVPPVPAELRPRLTRYDPDGTLRLLRTGPPS